MQKNLLAITLLLISINIHAQSPTFAWAKAMGGAGSGAGNSIATDAAGNVYTTGSFEGKADFDPGAGTFHLKAAGGTDIFISKLDATGKFVWAKSMGGASLETSCLSCFRRLTSSRT